MDLFSSRDESRSERSSLPCSKVAPWLVFPHGKNGRHHVFSHLSEPNNKIYRKSIPEIRASTYYQYHSHQGWLIVLRDDDAYDYPNSQYMDCFLWNPVSLEIIQLPNIFQWITRYKLYSCVLSSPPCTGNNDSVICLLLSDINPTGVPVSHFLLYCHPGDKQWRKLDLPTTFICDEGICWFKGKLYVIGHWQLLEIVKEKQHGSNDTTAGDGDGETVLKIVSSFDINFIGESSVGRVSYFYGPDKNIVESDDEFFMVVRYYRNKARNEVIELQVYKMDFTSMRWEELNSLGDHVLFLDSEGSTTLSGSARELGLKRGCVFFTLHNDKVLYTFNIEDGSVGFSLPCPNLPTPWLTPTWMSINNGKIAKEHIVIGVVEEILNEEKEEVSKNNNADEMGNTWGSLSLDILEMISSYLHALDYLHFRVVCKANRLAATAKIVQSKSLSPWIIFHTKKDTIYSFVEPIYNDKFFVDFPRVLLLGSTIRFSKGGWLLMTKEMTTIFFFNPFTREVIHLPDLPNDSYFLSGMCFSSLPTSSDCVVMGVGEWHKNTSWIFTISRGTDSWNYSEDHENYSYLHLEDEEKIVEFRPWKNNPVFYKGCFFCLDSRGVLGIYGTEAESWTVLNKPSRPCNSVYQNFLVECNEELFGVFLGQFRSYVKVFRLVLHEMVWVEVKTLGNHMLFISNTSTHSAIAPHSRMKNKIYFPRFHGEEIVYYSLDTHRYHTYGSDQHYSGIDFCNTKEQLYCSWIDPNWSKSTAQELDWCLSQVTEDD